MKRGLDWYKRDPIAFIDAVQGLGPDTIGAYAVIIDLIYARGGETPRDDRHLSGVLGCSTRKAKSLTDALISIGKLTVEGEVITNSRAKREAKHRRDVSETRAKQGRIGGEASAKQTRTGGENADGRNENNDLAQAIASNYVQAEKRREEESNKEDTNVSKKKPVPRDYLLKVLSEESTDNLIEHRNRIRKPMTSRAAELLAKKLAQCPDPNEAVDFMIEKGWQSISPEWIENAKTDMQPRGSPSRAKNTGANAAKRRLEELQNEQSRENTNDSQNVIGFIPGRS